MSLTTLFLIAVSLSMDAFAASIGFGTLLRQPKLLDALKISTFFGAAALLMPPLGWGIGVYFRKIVTDVDHWIAFVLLTIVGVKMIVEALWGDGDGRDKHAIGLLALITASLATSVDTTIIGVTLAFLETNIITAALIIGGMSFVLSLNGVYMGRMFDQLFGKKAEILGGLFLIGLGTKILIEHTYG